MNRINQRLAHIEHSKSELWFILKESIYLLILSWVVKFGLKLENKFQCMDSKAIKLFDSAQDEIDWFIQPKCDDETCSCCNEN